MKFRSAFKAHQLRVGDKFNKSSKGLVAYHKPGTGKTLTSIGILANSSHPSEVITPAPLTGNYEKELKKHLVGKLDHPVRIRSYEKFLRHPDIMPGANVILDEAHRIRNPDSKIYKALEGIKSKAHKILPMTGSATYNHPHDLASLVNLVSDKPTLPRSLKDFNAKYIHKVPVKPGFFGRLIGVKPSHTIELKNTADLAKKLRGKVDYHEIAEGKGDFPDMTEVIHKVPMSKEQNRIYHYAQGKMPRIYRYMIKHNMPINKSKSPNLNSFLSMMRQVANTPAPYNKSIKTDLGSGLSSPKLRTIADNVARDIGAHKRHKAIVYSNYLSGGIKPLSALLSQRKIPHAIFTGEVSKKNRKDILQRYNKGQIRALLVSSSGTEGLDTKGTRSVHVTEPHWNIEKLEQVKARARRFKSHAHLPANERNVAVHHYHVAQPKTNLLGRIFRKVTGGNNTKLIDEYMYNRAREKQDLNNKLLKLVRSAS